MTVTSHDIATHFVIMDRDRNAATIESTPTVFADIERDFDWFKGCELIACFGFDTDWDHWEMHPNEDDLGILLDGDVTCLLDGARGTESVRLSRGGEFVIVPRNTWHTATTRALARMLFITPGEGTRHETR